MFQIERQEKLLQHINRHKKAEIQELSRLYGVSKVTIRRDIDELAAKGLILKTHGGALSLKTNLSFEIPFDAKSETNVDAKRRIGQWAAGLVESGDIIILDSGSTTLEIARHLPPSAITVLTNDLKIAMELARKKPIQLIVAGGSLKESVYTLTGSRTVEFFRSVHANKTFLGCDAVDLSFGVSNRTLEEVAVKQAMLAAADEIIMVTDASKLHSKVFCRLCDIKAIGKLVIDRIDEPARASFEQAGVDVIVVP
ncbi:MAG: DeoR/GlpR family DNA-binding transcription regulator [Clostridiaceae bacterium]|nr:DeoR/GlpR family DNA-binding transcription regulator [Clostridiaceae bacterium]